ncbi:unnamed protein product [Haemonchus placei]|uniref:Uncharacterized protein n=1 Tax=Haemonchus placei TaxID=6290 RepID=A0A0N4WGN5_HAEPC|nr:unnamed protein product [Haemonchus placei]
MARLQAKFLLFLVIFQEIFCVHYWKLSDDKKKIEAVPDSPYTLSYPGSLVDFLRQVDSVKKFGKTYVELSNVLVSDFTFWFLFGPRQLLHRKIFEKKISNGWSLFCLVPFPLFFKKKRLKYLIAEFTARRNSEHSGRHAKPHVVNVLVSELNEVMGNYF